MKGMTGLEITTDNCDRSLIDWPEGFAVGVECFHSRSNRHVILTKRTLGDSWICKPKNGDPVFSEHSRYLTPKGWAYD